MIGTQSYCTYLLCIGQVGQGITGDDRAARERDDHSDRAPDVAHDHPPVHQRRRPRAAGHVRGPHRLDEKRQQQDELSKATTENILFDAKTTQEDELFKGQGLIDTYTYGSGILRYTIIYITYSSVTVASNHITNDKRWKLATFAALIGLMKRAS